MRTPAFWYRPRGFMAQLLRPLSWLYGLGRLLDVACARPKTFAQPVVCVGNLVAGGAGKTPTVLAMAALLQRDGIMPQIVTRGFGGSERGPRRVAEGETFAAVGDEALLLAQVAPVWVARDRAAGIAAAVAAGAPLVLLDDGLQSTTIAARVNLLVIDGASGFGNGLQLPAGPLRETVAAARARAGAVLVIGDDVQAVAQEFAGRPVFRAAPEYDLSQLDRHARYLAFAGLARPEKFFAGAAAQGLRLAGTKSFADHHPYQRPECDALIAEAERLDAKLLTTAKDAVRWPADLRPHLSILPLTLRFDNAPALLAFLRQTFPEAFHG